jgi:hypothetical protein
VKNENSDQLADSHNVFNKWKNSFSQLLNVHNVSDVRQIEMQSSRVRFPALPHFLSSSGSGTGLSQPREDN